MNNDLINAYEAIFNNFRRVDIDEYIAKESIQMTMLKLMMAPENKFIIRRPINFIINSSRFFAMEIKRGSTAYGKSSTYYESEANQYISSEDGEITSEYLNAIESNDFGQIFSFEDQYDIDLIKRSLGSDFDLLISNIDFSTGERLRGAKQESHRPRVYESDQERYRVAYIRKKVKKMFKNGYSK